eukprot:GHVN01086941.1.p1 GENE.GHVN01086941.1~~GHVN01086941.1.p1  ORF type:complete len:175 (+),score=51.78 GHVN01086941.1:208-732(+)
MRFVGWERVIALISYIFLILFILSLPNLEILRSGKARQSIEVSKMIAAMSKRLQQGQVSKASEVSEVSNASEVSKVIELSNVSEVTNVTKMRGKVHFRTYGTERFTAAKTRLGQQAIDSKWFDSVVVLGPSDLPTDFKEKYRDILKLKRGGGYWIWKIAIIKMAMDVMDEGLFI